jgi:ligand-binding SRPBCC domain-containing protein
MRLYQLRSTLWLPRPLDEAFQFFADARNLELLTPPWLGFRILTPVPIEMRPGAHIAYRLQLHGIPLGWSSEIAVWEPPHRFVDVQVRGPWSRWEHRHRFLEDGDGTWVEDRVTYRLPLGPLGRLLHATLVHRQLWAAWEFRQARLIDRFGGGPVV